MTTTTISGRDGTDGTSPGDVRRAWAHERDAASTARRCGDGGEEWAHLEQRAHILSQPMAVPHLRTHLAMLAYGIRARDRREVLGQVVRLAVAAPGSLTKRYPVGNTGGAGVSALKAMPIPADLQELLGGGS